MNGRVGELARDRDARIVDVIRALGVGEVVSYGDVAEVAGYPGRSRLVGSILSQGSDRLDHPDRLALPWWRVVNATGRLVPDREVEQARLLRAESVTVVDGRVRAAPTGRFVSSGSRNRASRRS